MLTMLGDAGTTEIARRKDAQGLIGNRKAAREGGTIADDARKALEAKSGRSVVSRDNYLLPPSTTLAVEDKVSALPAKKRATAIPKTPRSGSA